MSRIVLKDIIIDLLTRKIEILKKNNQLGIGEGDFDEGFNKGFLEGFEKAEDIIMEFTQTKEE